MEIKKIFLVEGMTCSGCERAVQRVLANINGVREAKANLKEATVAVAFNPAETNEGHLKDALLRIGYKITDQLPALGQREGSDEAIP